MKTFVQDGETISVTVPAGSDAVNITAGAGLLIGNLFGVAAYNAVIGATVDIVTEGVFTLAKTTSQAWTVGQKAYWDDSTKKITTTASSNKLVGVVVATAASNDTTGKVSINGLSPT